MSMEDNSAFSTLSIPPNLSQTDMMAFMVEYAAAQTGNQGSNDDEPSYPASLKWISMNSRLQKGLAASKAEMRKPIKSDRAGPSRIKASSPPWDPPYHALDDSPSSSRQGKTFSKPLAKDLITRIQSGEDVTESPLARHQGWYARYLSLHASAGPNNGSVPATAAAIADPPEPVEVKEEDHPTVFMEQLETYKANTTLWPSAA
ncbi:hypothetical protein B0H14DRAFT_3466491 [Mycena olivaceomarginata]|nr:hypothetical protein B0H14DRAFT_3466491 [Mycena olivaceomarginata]